jgi:hypothetical protein
VQNDCIAPGACGCQCAITHILGGITKKVPQLTCSLPENILSVMNIKHNTLSLLTVLIIYMTGMISFIAQTLNEFMKL